MRASGYYVVAGLLVLATVPMYRYIFARARALGLPWSELASASGTTKQALMRRVGGVDEDGAHADEG